MILPHVSSLLHSILFPLKVSLIKCPHQFSPPEIYQFRPYMPCILTILHICNGIKKLHKIFKKISEMLHVMSIFGIIMENKAKLVQTCLCLVWWFLRQFVIFS